MPNSDTMPSASASNAQGVTSAQQPPAGQRLRTALRRWLPDTVFGRLVLILVTGMLAAQFLTSSIWLHVRYDHMLEAPTRVIAERMADAVVLLETDAHGEQTLAQFTHPGFDARLLADAQPAQVQDPALARTAQALVDSVFQQRLPQLTPPTLTRLRLLDAQGDQVQDAGHRPASWQALLGFQPLTMDYGLQLRWPDGRWLLVDALLQPGGQARRGWPMLADLLWRVYALRVLVVVLLVLVAVRWAVAPLRRLSQAAQALERDVLHAAPMQESGPEEVRQAAQAFNRMHRRIVAHLEDRTRFLAAVSHDLRTPIARMRMRLALLEPEDLPAAHARLRADLASMERLTDDILAFIKAGQGQGPQVALQQVDLDSLVRSICQDWQDLGRDVHCQGNAQGWVEGDSLALRRAVENLVDNALRYGQCARVHIVAAADQVQVLVDDDGPGIAPALLAHICSPFERGEQSRNRATGGHGLGLAIVEAIAQTHGGELQLRNRTAPHTPGHPPAVQGLQACLRLPRRRPLPAQGRPRS